jgi:hypothetical protein
MERSKNYLGVFCIFLKLIAIRMRLLLIERKFFKSYKDYIKSVIKAIDKQYTKF